MEEIRSNYDTEHLHLFLSELDSAELRLFHGRFRTFSPYCNLQKGLRNNSSGTVFLQKRTHVIKIGEDDDEEDRIKTGIKLRPMSLKMKNFT